MLVKPPKLLLVVEVNEPDCQPEPVGVGFVLIVDPCQPLVGLVCHALVPPKEVLPPIGTELDCHADVEVPLPGNPVFVG